MTFFDGQSFSTRDAIDIDNGELLWSAPGSHRVLASVDGTTSSTWEAFDDGVSAGIALSPLVPCVQVYANDQVCARDLRPAPDGQQMAMTTDSVFNGYAVLGVRFLDLPYTGDPWAPQ